ncbi:MAG TPA: hypothetical protein VM802_24975 [Chitinophaga sp.]|uniref:hypothetical protein n=1 Tax=Chitinophaga sp. TaxID=1869181 RepID=UPI002C070DBD|nr:hypothetical protein [Chitinophaga sp.]HVI48145.1 hypothetical protein [Chitinophaga sp.]
MAEIKLPGRITDNFGDGLRHFFSILEKVKRLDTQEAITFDMSCCTFLTPLFLLPFFLLIKQERKNREIIITPPTHTGLSSYLHFTHFYSGLQPENLANDNYLQLMNEYGSKTYIPILDFPADRFNNNTEIRDSFLSAVNNILTSQVQLTGQLKTAVMYLIDEAVNNIVDHSREARGYIMAQYYSANGYLDVCIADCGISILGSYQINNNTSITTDRDAIKKASIGVSTKNLPDAENRGFGISTSRNMLINGLRGKYSLLSGSAILIETLTNSGIGVIPNNLSWLGTIVTLRIPFANISGFNAADYWS